MKISVAWLLDHIVDENKSLSVPELVDRFNQTTAEIESWHKVTLKPEACAAVQLTACNPQKIVGWCPEWNEELRLPERPDAVLGGWFLVVRTKEGYDAWATTLQFGGEKEMILPTMHLPEIDQAGGWKQRVETEDYILDVDNKSITHRPDLWGHRGIAREVAAIFDLTLRPLDEFLVDTVSIDQKKLNTSHAVNSSLSVSVESPQSCNRFATYVINDMPYTASTPWMAARLARVDSRSINAAVDCTNYVMFDLSQPMHAFDMKKITSGTLRVGYAQNKSSLMLLDGQTIELTDQDVVISDGEVPISLAGIMGGAHSGVSTQTTQILLESAHFDPRPIRMSALRHKIRTNASARFEKDLDPNQNTDALLRCLRLLEQVGIAYTGEQHVLSLGQPAQPQEITITHTLIEDRLGTSVASEFVVKTLEKLGFGVTTSTDKDGKTVYAVQVPVYRCTKDVTIAEDVIEEIGRFYGYGSLALEPPLRAAVPTDMSAVKRVYEIKHMLAYGLQMHEVENYALYDETFLQTMGWQPENAVLLKNPVSENAKQLVTSLIPHLIKAVEHNAPEHEELRFFEWARVWKQGAGNELHEHKRLAGIYYSKHELDFYVVKSLITRLFDTLALDVQFEQIAQPVDPWFAPFQTAALLYRGTQLGVLGCAHAPFFERHAPGQAILFELDGDLLLSYKKPTVRFTPLAKYPHVERDVSILIAKEVMARTLQETIANSSPFVERVLLIDFFTKPEWKDQKALTFRYIMQSEQATLTKQQIDTACEQIHKALIAIGAQIR